MLSDRKILVNLWLILAIFCALPNLFCHNLLTEFWKPYMLCYRSLTNPFSSRRASAQTINAEADLGEKTQQLEGLMRNLEAVADRILWEKGLTRWGQAKKPRKSPGKRPATWVKVVSIPMGGMTNRRPRRWPPKRVTAVPCLQWKQPSVLG